jgi:hypothetical protein
MATKKTSPWEQPLPENPTPDQLVAHYQTLVDHFGTTGTEGRAAVKGLAAAHAAQEAASGPSGFGPGAAAAEAAAAAANEKNNEPRYDANGNSLVPGTAAYEKGSPTKPEQVKETGSFGTSTPTSTALPTTTPSQTKSSSKSTANTNTDTSTNGYKTVKGLLQYNGKPFTGINPSDNQYYVSGKKQSPDDIKNDFIKNYGAQAAAVLAVPELSTLVTQAVEKNYTPDQYAAAFVNTTWAKQHPGTIGTAELQRLSDPSGYNIAYNKKQAYAVQLANQLGINLDPTQLGSQIDESNINNPNAAKFDQNAVTSGTGDIVTWMLQNPDATDQQIQQRMAKMMLSSNTPNTAVGGAIFSTAQSLANIAQQYGQSGLYNQNMFNSYAANIAAGTPGYDTNTFTAQQKTNAMNMYKPFADQIAAGATVQSLADPYISTVQNLLEVDPSDVVLGSSTGLGKLVSDAMSGVNNNGEAVDPLSFANTVRQQPQWLNTKNAQATLLGNANAIISKMGLG